MADFDVQQVIAQRLRREVDRRGFDAEAAARAAGIDDKVVSAYLDGSRPLSFDELRPLCQALSIDLMLLVAGGKRTDVRLAYRHTGARNRDLVSRAEHAFLLTLDLLPKIRQARIDPPRLEDRDQRMLLSEVNAVAGQLRQQFADVRALYEGLDLPVLTVEAGDDADTFDACCFNAGKHSLVYLNLSRPNVRLHYTLVHEASHCIFDREHDIPVDVMPRDLYMPKIPADAVSEFVAHKLAQFWLVPFDEAETLLREYPEFAGVGDVIERHGASPQVVVNALCDVNKFQRLRHGGRAVSDAEIRDAVATAVGGMDSYSGDAGVREFIHDRAQATREMIEAGRERFSDTVWDEKGAPVLEGKA